MAAVMGLDPYRNASDVWLDKRGLLVDDQSDKPIFVAGNRFESAVLDYAEESLGWLHRNPGTRHVDGTTIAVNVDACTENDDEPVEAKTVGMLGPSKEWWGDWGTDQVPDRVIIQATCHMMAWEREVCHVPTFIAGRGFIMFAVHRREKIVSAIRRRAVQFWEENVLAGAHPVNVTPHLEIVQLVKRTTEVQTSVDPRLIEAWLESKAARSAAEAIEKKAKAAVICALGTAEAGLCGDMGAVTYFEVTVPAHPVDAYTYRKLNHRPKGL